MTESLEKRFDEEMRNIYWRALNEANHNAHIFKRMLGEHGGRETARRLINAPKVSETFVKLWMKKRLDLTVEALLHDNPEWHPLFSEEELEIVWKRLQEYQYGPALSR